MLALRFAPLLPIPILMALALFGLLLFAYALWRGARGSVWRACALGIGLLYLAGPVLDRETKRPLPDIGLMVLDETPSMQVADRMAIERTARDALAIQAAHLPGLEWRTISVPAADSRTGESGTRLFAAISRALTGIPPERLAGIVAITDGQVHDTPVKKLPAPLHVLLPAAGEQIDRRLRVIEAPSFGLVGQSVILKVVVDDLGVAAGNTPAEAQFTIRHDGSAPRTAMVKVGKTLELGLPITKAGPTIVDLSVAPLPDEASDLNNHATLVVNGVKDRLRVLLLSGLPHAGEPVWRHMLKADPSVDLVHVTILRLPSTRDRTPESELSLISFPSRELFVDKISNFDLIILDRFPHSGLLPDSYLNNIADYVQNGGALLLSVGPEFAGDTSLSNSPLANILPASSNGQDSVVEQGFRPVLSALGKRHPVTEGLAGSDGSWGSWYRRIMPASTRGQAVLNGPDGLPLLLLDRVGRGRVALMLSDQIWLWARGHEGGGPAAELLRRVAHWLMKEPELEEENLTASIADQKLHIGRRTLQDGPPPAVTVTTPDGKNQTVALTDSEPGKAGADLDAPQPGLWTITDGVHTAYASASPADPQEIADLRVTGTILEKTATESGGSVHWLLPNGAPQMRRARDSDTQGGTHWIGLRENHAQQTTGLTSASLLPLWLAFLLQTSLLVAAWWREGYRERPRPF